MRHDPPPGPSPARGAGPQADASPSASGVSPGRGKVIDYTSGIFLSEVSVEDRFSQFSHAVDNLTRELLVSQPQYQGLYDMLRWHVGWIDENAAPVTAPAGKRLRPALCLLVAEAVDGDWR